MRKKVGMMLILCGITDNFRNFAAFSSNNTQRICEAFRRLPKTY